MTPKHVLLALRSVSQVGLAVLVVMGLTNSLEATPIVDRGVQSFFAQSLFADVAVVEAGIELDANTGFGVSYTGSTAGSTWAGNFAGQILGMAFSGPIAGSISAPAPSDPTMTIESGSLMLGKTPYALSGSFTFDETNGLATLSLELSLGGRNPPVTWKENTPLVWSLQGKSQNLVGQIISGGNAYNINISFTPDDITMRESGGTISSKLSPVKGNGPVVMNTGRGTLGFFSSFDGEMDLDITPVPGPSTLTLVGVGVLGLLGYVRRRVTRRRVRIRMGSSLRPTVGALSEVQRLPLSRRRR